MNEKYRQYYDLRNDKRLIKQHVPTEIELQEFYKWKQAKSEKLLKGTSIVTVITILILLLRNIF